MQGTKGTGERVPSVESAICGRRRRRRDSVRKVTAGEVLKLTGQSSFIPVMLAPRSAKITPNQAANLPSIFLTKYD